MSKKRLNSASSLSFFQRFMRYISRLAEKSSGSENSVYVVRNDTRVKKSAYGFPQKLGKEQPKAQNNIFQRR